MVVGGNRIAVDAAVAEASKHVDITSHRYGVTGTSQVFYVLILEAVI